MAPARPAEPYREPSWSGWGDSSQVPSLSDRVRQLLVQGLGVNRAPDGPPAIEAVRLPRARLSGDTAGALAAVIGQGHVLTDDESRIRHTRGKSTPDLLRLRAGDAADAPDAVLLPASHEHVLEVLAICSDRRVAVVPYGGGTSVVGGLTPAAAGFEAVVALDLRRMNALIGVDEISRLAEIESGLRAPDAESLLADRGYTLGHFPQSFEYASLGGFAATRSSGQASAGYGRFDDLVMALKLATPRGTMTFGHAPKSAAGPDLRQLILGSEGAFGVITSMTVAVRPAPEVRVYEGWRFESFQEGIAVLRSLAQDGPLPTVLRLSDEAETALNLARPPELAGASPPGCLAIIGYEGRTEEVKRRQAIVSEVLRPTGAVADADAGPAWMDNRYAGPYLRDALLGAGALVETLETVAFWSGLADLYAAVSGALREALSAQGTPPVILCHVSHVYATGASLYFTIGCAQGETPVEQWQSAKAAASDAILATGGSITHHHGVGTDHRAWYAREIGELGVSMLQAMKAELDPQGIMNPGVLLPPAR